MLKFLKELIEQKAKRSTYRGIYSKWVKIRESTAWAFVHPWERDFVEGKVQEGWQSWTADDARELAQLMVDVGKRMMHV